MSGNILPNGDSTVADSYWIKFREKGYEAPVEISDRAASRRSIRGTAGDYSWYDTPVRSGYIENLRAMGIRVRTVSRWLNAASAELDNDQLKIIRALPYVDEIERVSSYSAPLPEVTGSGIISPPKITAFDYGPSFTQISMISVDSLHNLGLSGNGILIGIMDTGFDTSHTAFSDLRSGSRILATYDFINGDSNVVDAADFQRTHGTQVLSAIGGFDEGYLIGPAYQADYVLAKTELVLREIQAEEDYWIAAAEWMESLGVDIISSSIGFIDWYDTTQIDGQTAAITRAANVAVSLGVIVVNAAGNEGDTYWRKVIPPADGDSVIAVGAVDQNGDIALFSSRGPTADGRIKPDFCAMGVSVILANWPGGYIASEGTSFATPLVAGGIALLLEGHPNWRISDIYRILKDASSHRYLPNNSYGWGIPDFAAAYYGQPGSHLDSDSNILIAPHPAVDSVVFYLTMPEGGRGDLAIHDLSGTLVNRYSIGIDAPGITVFVWDGKNSGRRKVASGIYICQFSSGGGESVQKFVFVSNF